MQPTRIDCKREANADMFMWPKKKEDACCERGSIFSESVEFGGRRVSGWVISVVVGQV